ncbi:MAG: flippase-like domain-containing protein [Clostridia bacterium]|nr:flippase-like domain-containing protein [Clostridia bacterium]
MFKRKAPEVIARGKRIKQIRKERLRQELKELNEVKQKSKKSKIINFLFIFAVFVGLIIYMINEDGIENIKTVLKNANYVWIIAGLACLVVEWLSESLIMHIPLKKMYPKHKYKLSLQTNIIGRLFNNITPFSSGGQPFIAYILKRHGLRASDTLSVLMMKFVVYQIGLFAWVLILLLTNLEFFNQTFGNYIWLVVLGFVMNLIATVFILTAGINKNIILKIAKPFIKLGSKIKIGKKRLVKDLDATLIKIDGSISNYSEQFNKMKGQRKTLLKMFAIQMIQLLAYFSIPFMIYQAFGNAGTSYIQVLLVQAILLLVMSFIPTPGSGLGAEGGFALFYRTIFATGLNLAILFWRIYTFYLPIIVGVLVFVAMNRKEVKDSFGK